MHADLDTLCTVVYRTADDLLPAKAGNARRRVTEAEVATLCVAQAITGIPSDRRFLAVARRRLHRRFRQLPRQPGFHKRRARFAETTRRSALADAADYGLVLLSFREDRDRRQGLRGTRLAEAAAALGATLPQFALWVRIAQRFLALAAGVSPEGVGSII